VINISAFQKNRHCPNCGKVPPFAIKVLKGQVWYLCTDCGATGDKKSDRFLAKDSFLTAATVKK
jgi:predicted RNA-binding Zn-ribbon protein involved in translation (DUF1610 family)